MVMSMKEEIEELTKNLTSICKQVLVTCRQMLVSTSNSAHKSNLNNIQAASEKYVHPYCSTEFDSMQAFGGYVKGCKRLSAQTPGGPQAVHVACKGNEHSTIMLLTCFLVGTRI